MKKNSVFSLTLVLYMTACFMLMFTQTACAYIDPSTTTFIIQAVAGVAVAIGAFVSIYWRKAKKKVADTLHIDENAKKEVEADIQDVDDDE